VLPLPPYAGTSGLSIHASNIRGAKLEIVRGGFVLRAIVAVDNGTGGRVFNASTHSWACMLYGHCPWATWAPTTTAQVQIGQPTMNAFSWLDAGRALSALGADARGPLAVFRSQRIGELRPLSGMPALEPPLDQD
jgi:hypothetical protein